MLMLPEGKDNPWRGQLNLGGCPPSSGCAGLSSQVPLGVDWQVCLYLCAWGLGGRPLLCECQGQC